MFYSYFPKALVLKFWQNINTKDYVYASCHIIFRIIVFKILSLQSNNLPYNLRICFYYQRPIAEL